MGEAAPPAEDAAAPAPGAVGGGGGMPAGEREWLLADKQQTLVEELLEVRGRHRLGPMDWGGATCLAAGGAAALH
jgi:hypothetical protein